MIQEKWLPLPFNNSYLVSNHGKVKSIDRIIKTSAGFEQLFNGRELVLRNNGKEPHLFFEAFKVSDTGARERATIYIHKIVGELFLLRPSKQHIYVAHIKTDYSNNMVTNLKWITHQTLMRSQPQRLKNPKKAWKTRRRLYGKTGMSLKTKNS